MKKIPIPVRARVPASERNENGSEQNGKANHTAAKHDFEKAIEALLARHFRKTDRLGVPFRESRSAALQTCLGSVNALTVELIDELNGLQAASARRFSAELSELERVGVALEEGLESRREFAVWLWVCDALFGTVRHVLTIATGREKEVDALNWSQYCQ
jgi:hypothetical protein